MSQQLITGSIVVSRWDVGAMQVLLRCDEDEMNLGGWSGQHRDKVGTTSEQL